MSEQQSEHQEKCKECDSYTSVQKRKYQWYCTPKAKYDEQPYWDLLDVSLCEDCFNKTDPNVILRGCDWWDAYDDLHYNYLMAKEEKAHWDSKTASMLGFKSPEELNEARKFTRKVGLPETSDEEQQIGEQIIQQFIPNAQQIFQTYQEQRK